MGKEVKEKRHIEAKKGNGYFSNVSTPAAVRRCTRKLQPEKKQQWILTEHIKALTQEEAIHYSLSCHSAAEDAPVMLL